MPRLKQKTSNRGKEGGWRRDKVDVRFRRSKEDHGIRKDRAINNEDKDGVGRRG